MIDELVKVANAMQNAAVVATDWHPKLKPLPKASKKSPCLRIWLTGTGHVKDVELMSEEQVSHLRKFEPDNGKSLPGFNLRPLYRLVRSENDSKRTIREMEAAIIKGALDWTPLTCKENDFWEKTRDGLDRCFGTVREELQNACDGKFTEGETLQKFINAVRQIRVQEFQAEYCAAVRRKIESGHLPLSLLCYFVTDEKKQKEDNDSRVPVPKFSVFLDVEDYTDYPVSHIKTIARLNFLLINNDSCVYTIKEAEEEKDVYGLDAQKTGKKFPCVTLPVLGGVILRSQVATVRAQSRYHLCESDTFPMGSESRKRVKAALEWIADRERDGATYGVAGDKELLFAYPRVLPNDKIPLAKLFGAQPDENLKEDKFERISASVIDQLKGLGISVAEAEIEVFSLRKMDKARTKVVYCRNTTVAALEAASMVWDEGCRNIPPLDVRDWSENKVETTGKSHPIFIECQTVFPIKLYRHLNTVWKRDGEQAGKVKIFEPSDGLRLLLDDLCNTLASYMMERFMQHAQGYFLTLCRSTGKHEIAKLLDKMYYPGILGLLLFKSGHRKEEYMKESAFLLGRCLRVADELHRLYCEVVRKKELPAELCGSSLLVSMMESPAMTLSQLAMRSAPYVKWARTCHDAEKGGLVHYWMRQWGEVADLLLKEGWPKRLSSDERAQVFLGYLSSFPKNEKVSASN